MADECIRHSKRELLLALAERLDQVLWCLLTATDPGCNEKARNRAALEAQKFAQEADGLLHGCDCPPRAGDPDVHEFLVAVNLAVQALGTRPHAGAEFIAAVRAKVPDASDAEILAAVRYGGALQVREIDQIDRYMTAQGEPNDEGDNAGRYFLAAPYIAAAAALEEYTRMNRKELRVGASMLLNGKSHNRRYDL
jgi:hypothetical protein